MVVVVAADPVSRVVLHANPRLGLGINFDAPEQPPLSRAELQYVFENVWADLRAACRNFRVRPSKIDVDLDPRLLELPSFSRVLGWASRTERLVGGVWRGMLSTESRMREMENFAHLGTLRVAPHPPGGWFRGEGNCTSRFRLEDVLLHETLHLLGIASTVRVEGDGLRVGMDYAGVCFPGEFDAHIQGTNGEYVVDTRCEFHTTPDDRYYVNGTRLYKSPGPFQDGTTLSHAHNPVAVVSPYVYACDPEGALRLTEYDNGLLRAVDVQCLPSGMRLVTTPSRPPWNWTEADPSTVQTLARAGSERRTGTSSLVASALWTWWFLAR